MGEAFFHDLTQIALKKTQVKDLEAENQRQQSFEASILQEMESLMKKSDDEARQLKKDMGNLQFVVDSVKLDALKKQDEHSAELAKL